MLKREKEIKCAFYNPRIIETADTKTANNEGRLFLKKD